MDRSDRPELQAQPGRNSGGALGASWAVLLTMGGTSMTYNLWHATHGGHMNIWLALPAGMAPVLAAMLLSHIVGASRGGAWMRVAAALIMVGAMSLSMSATAAVVAPALGTGWRWLFGLVIDAAALLAFQVILSDRHRRSADAGIATTAETARVAAEDRAREAQDRAAGAEATAEQLGSQVAELRAELAAASARKPARTSGRKPARSRAGASARKPLASSAPEAGDEIDELTTEAQALNILAVEPGISGSELGRRLGKTDRYGRDLIKRLSAASTAGE